MTTAGLQRNAVAGVLALTFLPADGVHCFRACRALIAL
jgi:hypothetical protein